MMRTTVAVIGAGPSGALAAYRLAVAGLDVHLIDPLVRRRGPSVETLSPEGRATLSRAGLWRSRPASIARPCPAISASWTSETPTDYPFITHPYGTAWHVNRDRFDRWLLGTALNAGAGLRAGWVSAMTFDQGWSVQVRTSVGVSSLRADYLVFANGRYTRISGLPPRQRIRQLCMIGCTARDEAPTDDLLMIEAIEDGWWYSMPAGDGQIFAGWITHGELLKRCGWQAALEKAWSSARQTRARLRRISRPSAVTVPIGGLPISSGDRWIAIGDAALARDPLSGDGLAAALAAAWRGAAVIIHAAAHQSHRLSSELTERSLEQYRRQRSQIYRSAAPRWPTAPFWTAECLVAPRL